MRKIINQKTIAIIIFTTVIVSFLLFYDFGESKSRIIDWITSFGHLPLFGVIALVTLWVLKQGNSSLDNHILFFEAWSISFLLGVITECIQALIPYRHFGLGTIYTNALGAAVFLCTIYPFHNRLLTRHVKLMRNFLLLLVIVRAYPIIALSVDTWNMERDYPVLSSFESPFEMSRYSSQDITQDRIRLHATEGRYSLKVDFKDVLSPGISMNYLHNDWRGYSFLNFNVFLEGAKPLELTIRINDRKHYQEYVDRFNKSFRIFPGNNHISIKLDDVKTSPKGRIMNMADITNIGIFAYKLKEPRTVYFDNFRLQNHG